MQVVSFSGGKDSSAMLLMMLEKGMRIDEIVFCDTGKEFPAMYEHIDKVEKYIGRKITKLQDKSFDYWMFEHVKTRGKHKGKKGYGWPDFRARWCTAALKRDIYKKHFGGYDNIIEYHGIAKDEAERTKKNKTKNRNIKYPLVEWGITEKDALEYCYAHGFDWDGLYEQFARVSCWCCPLQRIGELRQLYLHFPSLWAELKEMDTKAFNQFRLDYSVQELEDRFRGE